MFDLSKLTPAPWVARGEGICCGLYKEPEHFLIFQDDGGTWADTQFCALARNALDVMLVRRWAAVPFDEGWEVRDYRDGQRTIALSKFWPDPFTAIVEADKWYRENVENKDV